MKFTKMHGAGNDFIMVNGFRYVPEDLNGLALKLCHRNFAVGADGLIILLPADEGDFEMQIYNSDGTEAEMCGNGIRCAAIFAQDEGVVKKNEMTVITKAGIIRPTVIKNTAEEKSVKVDMGIPRLRGEEIPCVIKGELVLEQPIEVREKDYLFSAISMGNPHCVVFIDSPVEDFPVNEIGSDFEKHSYFPAKTNTEFVEVIDEHHVNMRVYERGCGETMACGTGACATAVASVLTGRCRGWVDVKLLGGTLHIEYSEGGHVFMTGPVAVAFTGEAAE
ncbi:MAG: diaminopimelate epimerase [Bacillota bacterium]|jgi:diaminopimelate epimerase